MAYDKAYYEANKLMNEHGRIDQLEHKITILHKRVVAGLSARVESLEKEVSELRERLESINPPKAKRAKA